MKRLSCLACPWLLLLIAPVWLLAAMVASHVRAEAPQFETDILPIIEKNCTGCHGDKKKKAELDLRFLATMLQGGESGAAVVAGNVEESLLIDMIASGEMPPGDDKQLSLADIDLICRWIEAGAPAQHSATDQTAEVLNQHDVLPIFLRRCTMCHGPVMQEAKLDLRSRATMLTGGKSGPAMAPGNPDESLLIKKIQSRAMPPKESHGQADIAAVTAEELAVLRQWIAEGAPEAPIEADVALSEPDLLVTDEDRQFWSFQPPLQVPPPQVSNQQLVRTPIDAFLLRALETKGLTYSAEADKLTLLRRASFDLTGLPPSPEDVQRFMADDSPRAYEKLIDRLLESPHYGERWGRYWLDLAGYADSEGKRQADMIRSYAYRYRDYVIRSFNDDKPYDRFLIEQLAGDELADYENAETATPQMIEYLVATGFLRMAPDGTSANPVNRVIDRIELIADEIDVLSRGVLGLTMKCARCHSHKYDPIPQRDYYRMMAIFKGAYDEYDWLTPQPFKNQWAKSKTRFITCMTPQEQQQWDDENRKIDRQVADLENQLSAQAEKLRQKLLQQRLAELPEVLHDDLRQMLKTPAKQRTAVQTYLAAKFEKRLRIDDKELARLDRSFKKASQVCSKKIQAAEAQRAEPPRIRALWDRGRPSPTYILRRGDPLTPTRLVGPGVPSVLTGGRTLLDVQPPWPGAKQTGRRLALARWITQSDHPLTARVLVNRVWKHHFGVGIVKSLDNFGRLGLPPSHPELLDHLAVEFVNNGWSIKSLHRLMMNSTAYRQVSSVSDAALQADLDNRLLSRMPLRRMDAEEVHDAILAVAGKLDVRQFGRPDSVTVRNDGLVTADEGEKGWRRSIYIRQRRKEMPTILETFDLPQMNPNCITRNISNIVSQPLHLQNDETIHKLAQCMAQRTAREAGDDPDAQVERAYLIALSRPPSPQERKIGAEALARLTEDWSQNGEKSAADRALADYCHTLINTAAFLYID